MTVWNKIDHISGHLFSWMSTAQLLVHGCGYSESTLNSFSPELVLELTASLTWKGTYKQAFSGSFGSTSFALNYLFRETKLCSRNAFTEICHRRW